MKQFREKHQEKIFNVTQACDVLFISTPKLLDLCSDGILEAQRTGNRRRWRVFKEIDVLTLRLNHLKKMQQKN